LVNDLIEDYFENKNIVNPRTLVCLRKPLQGTGDFLILCL